MKRTPYLYLLLLGLALPVLACGLWERRPAVTDKPPQRTRVRLVQFSTTTPTVPVPPAASPAPPTASPTSSPGPTALPPTATPTEPAAGTATPVPVPPTPVPAPPTAVPPPAAVAAEAAAVTVEQAPPLPVDKFHLGYGVQLAEAKNMELAAQNGFTWAKHDLNIRKETNFLMNADNLLNDLAKYGARGVLLKLVVWTEGGLPDAPRGGDEMEVFAENSARVAEFIRGKYGGSFDAIAYEIWNEPNLNFEWEGNPNPAEFVALVRATSAAIRAADPRAIIVSGAPSPGGDYDDLKFLEGMYASGIKGLVDAIGSHPYGGPWPHDHPTGIDEAGNGWPYFRKAEAQRAIMEKYGDSSTPIWATEFSWLAGLTGCDFGEHTRWQVTPQQQADYLVAAFDYAHHNWPWMGPMFVVYDFAISGRYNRCHPAAGYSLLRSEPDSQEIISPAARALFGMAKYSAW